MGFTSIPVAAKPRRLRAKWSFEAADDLMAFHGIMEWVIYAPNKYYHFSFKNSNKQSFVARIFRRNEEERLLYVYPALKSLKLSNRKTIKIMIDDIRSAVLINVKTDEEALVAII